MSLVDIESIRDDAVYNRYVDELRHTVRATRPVSLAPEVFNNRSIARVAKLMTAGIFANKHTHVIGSDEWQGEAAPDLSGLPEEMPRFATLHADGLGHTEVFRGFKWGFRMCAACSGDFVVRRPASLMAAWPGTCSAECKKAHKAAQARARRAAKKA